MSQYRAERLPNGYIWVFEYGINWVTLYEERNGRAVVRNGEDSRGARDAAQAVIDVK